MLTIWVLMQESKLGWFINLNIYKDIIACYNLLAFWKCHFHSLLTYLCPVFY